MNRFVPKEKMSKKAQKKMAAQRRGTWTFSPVTKRIDSRKIYNRKRISRAGYDDGREILFCINQVVCTIAFVVLSELKTAQREL